MIKREKPDLSERGYINSGNVGTALLTQCVVCPCACRVCEGGQQSDSLELDLGSQEPPVRRAKPQSFEEQKTFFLFCLFCTKKAFHWSCRRGCGLAGGNASLWGGFWGLLWSGCWHTVSFSCLQMKI